MQHSLSIFCVAGNVLNISWCIIISDGEMEAEDDNLCEVTQHIGDGGRFARRQAAWLRETGRQRGTGKGREMRLERKAGAWPAGHVQDCERLCAHSRTLRRELADHLHFSKFPSGCTVEDKSQGQEWDREMGQDNTGERSERQQNDRRPGRVAVPEG